WHGQRRQAGRRWGGRQEAGGLVVQLRGRPGGSGQPVDRRVGEQQVAVDRVLGELVGLGPLLELSTIQASCPAGESVQAQARAGPAGRGACGPCRSCSPHRVVVAGGYEGGPSATDITPVGSGPRRPAAQKLLSILIRSQPGSRMLRRDLEEWANDGGADNMLRG